MDWQLVNLINDFDPGVHNTQHYENSWHIPVSGNQILTTRENPNVTPTNQGRVAMVRGFFLQNTFF